jgi:hypothetical protein
VKRKRQLRVLALPAMACERGCGECCGVVPVTRSKLAEVRAYCDEHGIAPMPQGARCPLYLRNQCAIYAVRPRVCQAYGHSPRLSCSRGHDVLVDDQVALMRWVLSEGVPETTLHELVGLEVAIADSAARRAAGLR